MKQIPLSFDKAVGKLLAVSHEELKRREGEWKKQRKRKKRPKRVEEAKNG